MSKACSTATLPGALPAGPVPLADRPGEADTLRSCERERSDIGYFTAVSSGITLLEKQYSKCRASDYYHQFRPGNCSVLAEPESFTEAKATCWNRISVAFA
jgi:hypothetical protein